MLPFLSATSPFPDVSRAQREHGGLLAYGGGLSPGRLLDAYRRGIFPWGTINGHAVWYAPDPRMVLFPAELHISRSLRKILRDRKYTASINRDFAAVIAACSTTPRPGQNGTWITREMVDAYRTMHELGWAHSVEIRVDGVLCGGLYGLAIGQAFFGESMFSHRSNTSKVAFAHLCRHLCDIGIEMIDCQMHTKHLASLGGREISREEFMSQLSRLIPISPYASEIPCGGENVRFSARELVFDW